MRATSSGEQGGKWTALSRLFASLSWLSASSLRRTKRLAWVCTLDLALASASFQASWIEIKIGATTATDPTATAIATPEERRIQCLNPAGDTCTARGGPVLTVLG